jgi:2-succinyl-5-enolpyruvyl-6-hydroxy-3-cyclohexene-1-carboxylate synthase
VSVAAAFGTVLIDELVRCGMTDLCLSPGSRSTPIVAAALADDRLRVHVRIDERSASFLALGLARGHGRPAAVVCTSGSATANLHPAVVEADAAGVPLLVLTADRPPELRHTGANQAIDQRGLYGRAVRWDCEVGVPEDRPELNAHWRATACRAWAEAIGTGGPPGPVHLNLALREPLVAGNGPPPTSDLRGRPDGRPWTAVRRPQRAPDPVDVAVLAGRCRDVARGIVLVGGTDAEPGPLHALAAHLGWPVLAEPHSSARLPGAVAHHDLLLRHVGFAAAHRPGLVLTVGRVGLAKSLLAFLHGVPQVLVDPDAAWLDPGRNLHGIVAADGPALAEALVAALPARAPGAWLASWQAADDAVGTAVAQALSRGAAASEPAVARDLTDALPDGAVLVVGSSMPIRDLDLFQRPRAGLRVVANRGASGIDGFVSTALGVALAHDGPAYALAGDLSLLHDQNGLLVAAGEPSADLVLVVVNNDGGGIFSFLPQADTAPDAAPGRTGEAPPFERLFGTPHGVDLAQVAAAAGVGHRRVQARADLLPAVAAAARAGGVQLVEVRTDRATNVALHQRIAAAAAAALDRHG